jgi:basic membrane protein A
MKRQSLLGIIILITITLLFTNCKKDKEKSLLRVGFVTGVGSLYDGGFNLMAYTGALAAMDEINMTVDVKQSQNTADIESNIRYFAENGFDVIISLGYDAAQPTYDLALQYPGTKFMMLDHTFTNVPSNMVCTTYKIDQASFPCGFLAAYWAWSKNAGNPKVGFVAGPLIPSIEQFTTSFTFGLDYFNTKYNKSVDLSGYYSNSFSDTLQGAWMADSLIHKGAEVIFACAGKTGNGALYKVKERNKTGIGVDTDQFFSIPAAGPNLLTSCMKSLDVFVTTELINIYNDAFHGGQTIQSTLANQGVGLAPYHQYETLLPDSIKQAVTEIKAGIINGTISTGWPK